LEVESRRAFEWGKFPGIFSLLLHLLLLLLAIRNDGRKEQRRHGKVGILFDLRQVPSGFRFVHLGPSGPNSVPATDVEILPFCRSVTSIDVRPSDRVGSARTRTTIILPPPAAAPRQNKADAPTDIPHFPVVDLIKASPVTSPPDPVTFPKNKSQFIRSFIDSSPPILRINRTGDRPSESIFVSGLFSRFIQIFRNDDQLESNRKATIDRSTGSGRQERLVSPGAVETRNPRRGIRRRRASSPDKYGGRAFYQSSYVSGRGECDGSK
jgi:hypothetical protein